MSVTVTFDESFRKQFVELLALRRDVRNFKSDPIPDGVVTELVSLTRTSPSVGYSQPWRFVRVDSAKRRAAVIASFERANADALASYEGERATSYARLKLAGLHEAPVHLAVFCDDATETGKGLGAKTMPETLAYSTTMAIYTLWLAARARGIGVGWVSILYPQEIERALDVPDGWRFIAYLCLGYPASYEKTPELLRAGWEKFDERSTHLTIR
uniref:Putative cob(II)yrinic acid a,c-diamide reductase n=1 Tax=mine drainage metagenome TaxID=410659 RepID=E6Q875_9ZZZZ